MIWKPCVVYWKRGWYFSKTLSIEGSDDSEHVKNASNLRIYINNIHKNCTRLNDNLVRNSLKAMLSIQVGVGTGESGDWVCDTRYNVLVR